MQVVKHSERDAEKLLVSKIKKLGGRGRGDQFVKVTIEVPKNLSKEQKEILQSFESTANEKNYAKRKSFFEFVEMKSETGMLSVLQKICISHLRALGCHVEVLYGVKNVDTYVTRVKKMIKNGGAV